MTTTGSIRVAIAQGRPAYYRLGETLDLTERWVERAAQQDVRLLAFPETWLPGYPAWLDVCRDVAVWDSPQVGEVFADLRRNSVVVPGPETERLCALAREHSMVLSVSVHERVEVGAGNGTLYNTLLTIDANGSLAGVHRKLMPTYTERLIWGQGDGESLSAVATAVGRVGGLICWEHWMPVPRALLHESAEKIHVAAWPMVKEMNLVASRHYAFEGRCFVLAAGALMLAEDLPAGLEAVEPYRSDPASFVLRGGSAIIAPDGRLVAGPVLDQEELLVADLDLEEIERGFLTLDASGHYSRSDLFEVRRKR